MDSVVQSMPHGEWILLYNPWGMGKGYHCTIHDPWVLDTIVQPMTHGGKDTIVQPMTHGERIPLYNP